MESVLECVLLCHVLEETGVAVCFFSKTKLIHTRERNQVVYLLKTKLLGGPFGRLRHLINSRSKPST